MVYRYLEIKLLSDFIKENENKWISWELTEQILNILLKNLEIKYADDMFLKSSARYVPGDKTIYINFYRLLNSLDNNITNYKDRMSNEDYEKSPIYFLTQSLIHEVEHSKQHLMGQRKIYVVDEMLANAYDYLYKFIMNSPKDNPAYVEYRLNENFYLLERNAQVESTNKISVIADKNNAKTIHDIFANLHNLYLMCGYIEKTSGSIYETFQNIGLEDTYLDLYVNSNLSEEDRVYYGLPIKRATRQKLLQKQKNLQVDL